MKMFKKGMGRIAYEAAKRFHGFGCNILYCNASNQIKPNAQQLGAELVPFDQLLQQSDFVVS